MDTVSQVVLTRKGKQAILQGMWHVAPSSFYESIQLEIDDAKNRGDQIFSEGISVENFSPVSFNERFWEYFFESIYTEAEAKGWKIERDSLIYPESSILADINIAELVDLLNQSGFSCKFPFILFRFTKPALHPKIIDGIEKGIYMAEGKCIAPKDVWDSVLSALLKSYGKKIHPIIIVHRNRVAMNTIKKKYTGGNIFVTYGNAHIPGLTNLFLFDGWVIDSIAEIDPENSAKPVSLSIFEPKPHKAVFSFLIVEEFLF